MTTLAAGARLAPSGCPASPPMKRRLLAALAFATCLVAGRAEPGAELDAAIRALLGQPNFTWRVIFERTEDGRRRAYDGRTARGGYTVVQTVQENVIDRVGGDGADQPMTIVYLDARCVAWLGGPWLTARELQESLHGRPQHIGEILAKATSVAQATRAAGMNTRTAYWEDHGNIYLPRPDLILRLVLNGLENARAKGRSIEADVAGATVEKLFEAKLAAPEVDWGWVATSVTARGPSVGTATRDGRRVPVVGSASEPPAPRGPRVMVMRYRDGSGNGTFWIEDGMVVKFELRLEAVARDRTAEGTPHHVVISATMREAGTTAVDVPAGARERLER